MHAPFSKSNNSLFKHSWMYANQVSVVARTVIQSLLSVSWIEHPLFIALLSSTVW